MEIWLKFGNWEKVWKFGKKLEIWKKDWKFGKKLKIWKIFGNLKK